MTFVSPITRSRIRVIISGMPASRILVGGEEVQAQVPGHLQISGRRTVSRAYRPVWNVSGEIRPSSIARLKTVPWLYFLPK